MAICDLRAKFFYDFNDLEIEEDGEYGKHIPIFYKMCDNWYIISQINKTKFYSETEDIYTLIRTNLQLGKRQDVQFNFTWLDKKTWSK